MSDMFGIGKISQSGLEWAAKVEKMVENLGEIDFEMNGLEDVSISSATSGQFLKYNGDKWVNYDIVVEDVQDIEITTPQNGDILVFDETSGLWINESITHPSEILNVNFVEDDGSIGCDKTYEEIVYALANNKTVIGQYNCKTVDVSYSGVENADVTFNFIYISGGVLVYEVVNISYDNSVTSNEYNYTLTAADSGLEE